ncbi:hypothetical protein EXIGLDRAFT_749245 [Exidia glandulosa HHB12029]|uniref:U1-type domain-containing protein n=1 Tax=Exidia glandulosa HHB12029 TaxID=1314781 RepID=A0A165ICF0_EXIGL|nr:hypothetical protein EXIGLDRAFT_749245 [Exidia glandulosa HHB12029]
MTDFVRRDQFIQVGLDMYKCSLCTRFAPMTREDAIRHEDNAGHVQRLRDLDSCAPLSSPMLRPVRDDNLAAPLSSPSIAAAARARPYMEPVDDNGDIRAPWRPVHGPRLADDDDNQIYDNWAGALGSQYQSDPDDEDGSRSPLFWGNGATAAERRARTPASSETEAVDETARFAPREDQLPTLSESQIFEPFMSSGDDEDDWFPWVNRQEALFDIMSSFPRSVFSEKELSSVKWLMERLGLTDLPSADKMRKVREEITEKFGADTSTVDGKCGNIFSFNDIETIVRHEWANPLVRPHIETYPQRSGCRREHLCQGDKWVSEVDASLAGPMARFNGQDYFVGEVAIADLTSDKPEVPSYPSSAVLIQRWHTTPASSANAASHPDSRLYARVERLTVSTHGFRLEHTGDVWTVPLSAFITSYPRLEEDHQRYSLPDPKTVAGPNPLREKANGRRVLAVAIGAYCDDTSGNVSKKWNKHNSFLWLLAGLPRALLQLAYSIHFFSTSNVAPPLEMLEALKEVIAKAQVEGWEAWDCLYDEDVLLIPWVLLLEGDNPMHRSSKLAKFYADEIRQAVEEQLAATLNAAPSKVANLQTASGVKDAYFLHFFGQLEQLCAEAKGSGTKDDRVRALLTEYRTHLPDNLFNPAFDIPGLDPTADTPVEILHVVLLGFVKYFWRDAVSRLDAHQKAELIARLCSVDVSGLGIDRVQARTLVQYAGSLVGRDFRTVLQLAPSVLPGFVSPAAYTAWLSLCDLSALVFRPVIENIDTYIPKLECAIDRFLEATALWNYQWFNKPKFHIILHLPLHIRRFGPAPLYATETFESFNHVIRLRSIHSNQHAPSLDIARAFSHLHAVRHILSGGWIPDERKDGSPLRQAGPKVRALLDDPKLLDFMCMEGVLMRPEQIHPQFCATQLPQTWSATLAAKDGVPEPDAAAGALPTEALHLENSDTVAVGTLILHTSDLDRSKQELARVKHLFKEMQQPYRTWLIVAPCETRGTHATYKMPNIVQIDTLKSVCSTYVLGTAASFHDCITHRCAMSKTLRVRQEGFWTGRLDNELQHTTAPAARVLNLAQLRNSSLLDSYRTSTLIADRIHHRESVIQQALVVRKDIERAQAQALEEKAARAAKRRQAKDQPPAANAEAPGAAKRRRVSKQNGGTVLNLAQPVVPAHGSQAVPRPGPVPPSQPPLYNPRIPAPPPETSRPAYAHDTPLLSRGMTGHHVLYSNEQAAGVQPGGYHNAWQARPPGQSQWHSTLGPPPAHPGLPHMPFVRYIPPGYGVNSEFVGDAVSRPSGSQSTNSAAPRSPFESW